MTDPLGEIMSRDIFMAPVDTDREREIRIILGCAGVGASPGQEYAHLDKLGKLMAAGNQGVPFDQAVQEAFPGQIFEV